MGSTDGEGRAEGGAGRTWLAQDLGADGGFFLGAAFRTEAVHAAPELEFRFPPIHLRRDLLEVELHLGVSGPAMEGGGSGWYFGSGQPVKDWGRGRAVGG